MFDNLLQVLETRFEENMHRHLNIKWSDVIRLIKDKNETLQTLKNMEDSGGMPDVVEIGYPEITFVDMAKESPNRRSCCYDDEALKSRKKFPPKCSVEQEVNKIGGRLLTREEYLKVSKIELIDQKSSSWLLTPENIRKLGGSIFGESKFGEVFVSANGADSYYSSRGFRIIIRV